jgi:transcriptional regulator with XRE-family HTH domain
MTPFGEHLRQLRKQHGYTLEQLAEAIGVSTSYLSGLERGKRGKPSWVTLQRLVATFNIIWDEAEDLYKLAGLSKPIVKMDTRMLSAKHTHAANRLSRAWRAFNEEELDTFLKMSDQAEARTKWEHDKP